MKVFIRVENSTVVEVLRIADDEPPLEERFPEFVIAMYTEAPPDLADTIEAGWTQEGNTFVAPPPPIPVPELPPTMSPLEFRKRWTAEEKARITLAAHQALSNGDAALRIFIDDIGSAGYVFLGDPDLLAGFDIVVAAGLLTRERADEILGR
ncbi:MAG TPA: hypothetical protein VNZ61_08680 [Roseomonas sp.]|nr:hypothetical protein [Roseomonas sp.]